MKFERKYLVVIAGVLVGVVLFLFIVLRAPLSGGGTAPPLSTSSPPLWATKISIDGVAVNNVFRLGKTLDGISLVLETDSYQISYYEPHSEFIISILDPDFPAARIKAEDAFLTLLGVSSEESCMLSVYINTPYFVNPEYSGANYPLRFCKR